MAHAEKVSVWTRKSVTNRMRSFLYRYSLLDVVARWWYVLVIGAALGLIYSLMTGAFLLRPKPIQIIVSEGPPSRLETAAVFLRQEWKDDVFFLALGAFTACGVIYVLEEIRRHSRDSHH